ncbi:MAG: heparinase, partial [Cytophagales bacterium]|nr:heparinase [Cytophagales bacterium]
MNPKQVYQLARQMGGRAFAFRAWYEFRKRSGLLRRAFPTQLPEPTLPTLDAWRRQSVRFFFESREGLRESGGAFVPDERDLETLAVENQLIAGGHVPFFNAGFRHLGRDYDWLTHPETGYRYSPTQHWTAIRELDPTAGDIKFVWEKARFAYLYPVIRHDFHNRDDRAAFVFSEIENWIDANPLNCGPHYVCSQETSLRVLNWTFALHYYKHSTELTETRFGKILRSIYGQMRHVAANIDFSRIAVRNNHAVTECLGLYLAGLLYPFFPESRAWRENGKRWLTEEGLYQIYEDGSYLQFSMNYHRVVIQLFTWAFGLAHRNGDRFPDALYDRLRKSLHLLHRHQDTLTGHLPNYGANDGALFFRLNACDYRDYRPQLNTLHQVLYGSPLYANAGPWQEDEFWMNSEFRIQNSEFPSNTNAHVTNRERPSTEPNSEFKASGFYVLRDAEKFAFVRCGNHPDRPSQADNLHLDL